MSGYSIHPLNPDADEYIPISRRPPPIANGTRRTESEGSSQPSEQPDSSRRHPSDPSDDTHASFGEPSLMKQQLTAIHAKADADLRRVNLDILTESSAIEATRPKGEQLVVDARAAQALDLLGKAIERGAGQAELTQLFAQANNQFLVMYRFDQQMNRFREERFKFRLIAPDRIEYVLVELMESLKALVDHKNDNVSDVRQNNEVSPITSQATAPITMTLNDDTVLEMESIKKFSENDPDSLGRSILQDQSSEATAGTKADGQEHADGAAVAGNGDLEPIAVSNVPVPKESSLSDIRALLLNPSSSMQAEDGTWSHAVGHNGLLSLAKDDFNADDDSEHCGSLALAPTEVNGDEHEDHDASDGDDSVHSDDSVVTVVLARKEV